MLFVNFLKSTNIILLVVAPVSIEKKVYIISYVEKKKNVNIRYMSNTSILYNGSQFSV